MVEYWLPIANTLSGAVLVVCVVAVLIAINAATTGRVRVLGLVGVLTVTLSATVGALNGSVGPWLSAISGTGLDFYGLGLMVASVAAALGMVLLALAVTTAVRASAALRRR